MGHKRLVALGGLDSAAAVGSYDFVVEEGRYVLPSETGPLYFEVTVIGTLRGASKPSRSP